MFKLEFSTGNAAFADNPDSEVARILREIADKIEASNHGALAIGGKVADENGNTVGEWSLTVDSED